MTVVQVVQSGKTKDSMLAACIRNIWLEASIHDITIKIDHIKGKNNVVADALSRLYSDKPVDCVLLEKIANEYIWEQVHSHYFNLNLNL